MDKNYRNTKRLGLLRSGWRVVTLTAVWLGISVGIASAQAGLYGLTTPTGNTYASLTGGTAITADAQLTSGTSDDGYAHVIMPFQFNFAGISTDSVTFSTNYWIAFGHQAPTAAEGRTAGNLWTSTAPNRTIAPWFRDGNANFGSTGLGEMRHGTDPNNTGVYVFEWFQATGSGFSVSATIRITMQVKLYGPASASPGRIEIHYGPTTGSISTAATIGIESGSSGSGNFLNALNGSNSVTSTSSAWPGNNFVYRFDPPAPMAYAGNQVLGITNRAVGKGTVNQAFAVLNVQTTGSLTPLDVTSISVNTGNSVLSNIENLKVYYTGNSTTLTLANQFGNTVAVPTANNVVTGTTPLVAGNNYFWVLYDIKTNATTGDSIRAIIPSVTVGGTARVVADSATALPRGVAAPISGTLSVGTGQTYPNFTALFTAINTAGLSGNVIANITSDIVEPAAASVGQWNNVGGGPYTLTIRPSGSARKISGDVSNSGVLVFIGSDNVTIDGRIGGTGTARSLTIENISNVGGVAILVAGSTDTTIGGCDNFTLRNTKVMAGPTVGTTIATVGLQTQGTGRPSNNMLITENEFTRAYRGILIGANAPTTKHLGLQITNNVFGSDNPSEYISLRGIAVQNAYGAVVNNNRVFNMYFSLAATNTAIDIATGSDSCIVTNNRIQNISSTSTSGYGAYGINMSAGNNHFVYNNEIANVYTTNYSSTSTTFNAFGIRITAGNGIRVINNTVNMATNYGTVGASVSASAAFVMTSSVTGLQLVNNIFSNQITSGAATNYHFAYWFPSAYNFGTGIATMDRNNAFVGSQPYHYIGKTGTTAASNNFQTLAAWQTLTARDSNTISTNPMFFSTIQGLVNSPTMDNSGIPYPGITTDITGATRSTTTPDMGAYEYTPINTDLSALVITAPVFQGCPTATQSGQLLLKNTGLQPINFSTNALSVTMRMSGAASDTETVNINTGTLAVGDTLVVNIPNAFNMLASGVYTFNASFTLTGDGFANNNNFAPYTVVNAGSVTAPFGQTFEGTTTASLTAANWTLTPNWVIGAASHGNPGNGLYFNLYSSAAYQNPGFTMPSIGPVPATANFSFSYRLMNYTSYPADSIVITGGDSMVFEISTNCGLTFTRLYKIDSTTHTPSRQWSNISIPLSAYAGQNVVIRMRAQWAAGDYYLDLDNIGVASPVAPVSLIAPANNATLTISGVGSTSINARWTRASADPVTYTWLLSDTSKNFAAPLASFSSNNNGLDTVLTLTYSQIDALLASLGVPVGSSAQATWTVRITAGGSNTWAVDTFNVTLNRVGLAPLRLAVAPAASGTSSTGTRGPTGLSAQTFLRVAAIVTKAELLAAGIDSGTVMQSVALRNIASANAPVRGMFRLYIRNAPDTTSLYTRGLPWTSAINGLTLIHQDSLTVRTSAGLFTANFNQPFVYTGGAIDYAFEWNAAAPFATTGATYSANTAILGSSAAAQSSAAFPANLTNTANTQFRPEMTWGVERKANDLEVNNIWAMGRNPRIYGSPENITAFVKNNSFQTITNAAISLNISGANTGTTSVNVTLAPDSTAIINLPFNAANTGFTNISVSAPADQLNANNSRTWLQEVTDSIYSYADTVTAGLGSVGFNTGSGLLLNKYRVNGTRQIKAARIRIANNPATVGNSLYAVVTNDTGLIIAQSAPVTIATADLNTWKIFPFTVAPNITDTTFMIGLAQPANATGYYPVAFQNETPTRPNAYFGANLGGGGASSVAGFRLLIEAHVGAIVLPDTLSAFNLLTPANNDSINVDGAPTTALNFTWQPSVRSVTGAVTYDMTLETTNANPIAILTRTGLTSPSVAIDYGVLADTLSSRGIAVGNSFSGRWKVVANSGTLSKEANAKFNIKLRRGQITSIEETDLSKSIKLYPNPANNVAILDFNGALSGKMDVVIVNAMGQEMLRKEVAPATTGEVSIDLSSLQQGMYFVRITNGNELAVKRLMIQR